MYKLTFNLKTPIILDHNGLMLDSLLAWSYFNEMGVRENLLHIKDLQRADVPITMHPDGYHICSRLLYEESESDLIVYKKKYRTNQARFANAPAKIQVNKGEYKSYQIPYQTIPITKAWFIFESDNLDLVEHRLRRVLGLGKKVMTGNGQIESYKITEIDSSVWDQQIWRPIPERMIDKDRWTDIELRYQSWHYPYWDSHFRELCVVSGIKKVSNSRPLGVS